MNSFLRSVLHDKDIQFSLFAKVFILFTSKNVLEFFKTRPEVNNPVTSLKYCKKNTSTFIIHSLTLLVKESLFLLRNGVNIYIKGNLQASPWLLTIFSTFDEIFDNFYTLRIFFLVTDFLVAFSLYRLTQLLGKDKSLLTPIQVAKCYFYNPFGIIAVFGMNWTLILSFLQLTSLNFALQGNVLISSILCGFLIHVDFNNLALIAPIALTFKNNSKKFILNCMTTWTILLISSNWILYHFWDIKNVQFMDIIDSVYISKMRMDNIRPNSGMFWYLYAQVFPAFISLLKFTFQMTLMVFWPACAIKFHSDPIFMFISIIGSQMILKPYPSVVDYSLYFGLLMTQFHLFERTRVLFITFFVSFGIYILKIQIWRYWIELPGFNANFYYIFTLIWNASLVIIYLDIVSAYNKHQIYCKNKKLEGKEFEKCKLFQR